MEDANYASNPVNRCYFCKAELFTTLDRLARGRGFRAIAYGENADDAQQVRPGRQAASEFEVLAPLKEVGLTKSEIRELSRAMHLATADIPAQPCLSSRIPHGTPVTVAALNMIERAEAIVRSFGFRDFSRASSPAGKSATRAVGNFSGGNAEVGRDRRSALQRVARAWLFRGLDCSRGLSFAGGLGCAPVEHDLSGVPRFHQLDRFFELRVRKAVRDDRRNVEAALDHRGHLIPGLIHLAAVDSFNR